LLLQSFGAIRCNCYGWFDLIIILVENWIIIFKQYREGIYKIMKASDFFDCDIFYGLHFSARHYLNKPTENRRKRAAKPVKPYDSFRCNVGAIRVEKMDFVDSMDACELTLSREKTEITPINRMDTPPRQFEVSRSIH